MARLFVAAVCAVFLAGGNAQGIDVNVTVGASASGGNFTPVSARQGYPAEDENAVNNIINSDFAKFYEYLNIMAYFKRDDKDLMGFAKFFERLAMEHKECALKYIKYQTRRGGVVSLGAIAAPSAQYVNGLDAFQVALNFEKQNYDALVAAYSLAIKNSDPELAFDIEKDVHRETKKIKEIAGVVRDLQRADSKSNKWGGDNNFGEYHVDHDLERKEKEHEKHEMDRKCKKHHKKHDKHGKKQEW